MSSSSSSSGIGLPMVLFLIFLVLKLCGVIAWSWWWVTSPLWIGLAVVLALCCFIPIGLAIFAGLAAWAHK